MPKIPRDVRPEWMSKFLKADTANELLDIRDKVRARYPYPFDDFIRNSYIAAKFAKARLVKNVRLRRESPDFELIDSGGSVSLYEATEAFDDTRRRDDENRAIIEKEQAGLSTVTYDPPENWLSAEKATLWLHRAAARKALKQYPPKTSLVIYLNGSFYGDKGCAEIISVMQGATAVAKDRFEEIWVLWDSKIYLQWVGGISAGCSRNTIYSFC